MIFLKHDKTSVIFYRNFRLSFSYYTKTIKIYQRNQAFSIILSFVCLFFTVSNDLIIYKENMTLKVFDCNENIFISERYKRHIFEM